MVSRIFSAFLTEQPGWPGAGMSCAFINPFSTSFTWHLMSPGNPITLWVLLAAGLPRLLPLGRAVSMKEPVIASSTYGSWLLGTARTGEGAVGAKGDGKRDFWVRGKETPSGSETAACGSPGVSIKGTPSGETVFKEKRSRRFPAKNTLWAAPPLRKTC